MGNKFDPDAFLALPENGTPATAPIDNARAKRRTEIDAYIKAASDHYGIDERVIRGIMNQESAYNPQATSPKGASGLMQLMPDTARSLGVKDIYDPYENIMGGTKYFKQMLDTYGGDVKKALAAYNAGPGAVDKYGGIPPYAETQNYVAKIFPGIAKVQPYKRSVVSTTKFDPDAFLNLPEPALEAQGQRDIRDLQKVSGEQSPETPSIPMEEYKGFQVPVGNNGRIRRAAIDRLMERQGGNLSGLTELITGKQPKERNFLDNAFIEATTDAGDVLRGTQEKNPAGFGEAMGNAISHFTNSALNLVPGVSGLRGKIMGTGQAAVSELEKMLGDATTSVDPKTLELLNAKMEEFKRMPMSERVAASAGSQVEKLRSTLQGNEDVYKAVQAGDALPDIPEDQKTFLDKAKENELIENEVLRLRKEQTPGSSLAGEVMGSILPYNAAYKVLNVVPGLAAVEKGKFIPELAKLLGRGAIANVAVGQAQNPTSDWKKIGTDAAFGAGGEAVGKLIPAVLKGIGSTVEKTGPQLANTALDVPLKELKQGNFGEELLKKGLYGTEEGLLNKAQEGLKTKGSEIEALLKKFDPPVDVPNKYIPSDFHAPTNLPKKVNAYVDSPERANFIDDFDELLANNFSSKKVSPRSGFKEITPNSDRNILSADDFVDYKKGIDPADFETKIKDMVDWSRVPKDKVINNLKTLRAEFAGQPNVKRELTAIDRAIAEAEGRGDLSLLEANKSKIFLSKRAKNSYGKDQVPIQKDIDKTMAHAYRQGIEDIVPEVAPMNKDYHFLDTLEELLQNKAAKKLKLPDVGSTPGGRGFIGSAIGNMPTSLTLPAAQILRQVGRGIQGGTKAGQFLSPTSGGGWFRVLEDLLQQDR